MEYSIRRALCWLLFSASACSTFASAHSLDAPPAGIDGSIEWHRSDIAEQHGREHAITRARETLRAAGVDTSALTVKAAEPFTWPDSSLGCAQQGTQYLQVLSAGYRVTLQGLQGDYVVHVAGDRTIVCSGIGGTAAGLNRPLIPVRNLDVMTQRAREMLAGLMHTSAEQIGVVGFDPQVWPDTGLGCPSATPPVKGRISGYRIVLEHQDRRYTFNTDLHRVLACPPIETE